MQVRLTTTVILAVIFGSVFWQKGLDRTTEQGVKRIAALQFLAVFNMGFNNAFTVQPILAVERGVFYRERAAYYYNSVTYALAQGDVEIPFLIVQVSNRISAACMHDATVVRVGVYRCNATFDIPPYATGAYTPYLII